MDVFVVVATAAAARWRGFSHDHTEDCFRLVHYVHLVDKVVNVMAVGWYFCASEARVRVCLTGSLD